MRKIIGVIIISILAIGIGFFIGKNFLKPKEQEKCIAEKQVNEVKINSIKKVDMSEIPTSVSEEKVSINAEIIKKTYYNECNHEIEYKIKDIKRYINMTKNEIQKEFPNWEIKEFSPERIVLYKEENDFCNEHFLVKDEAGYVTIYTIDNNENILELLDKTDIATEYLARNR